MSNTYKNRSNQKASMSESQKHEMGSMMNSAAEKSQEYVKNYPISSTMVALGAGAAFGLLVATAIGRSAQERRQSYLSSLGNNIASSLGNVVPDSLNWNR